MSDDAFGIIELLLVFGVILGLAVFDLVRTKAERKSDSPAGETAKDQAKKAKAKPQAAKKG